MTLPAKIIAQKNVLDTKFPWLNLIELQFNDAEDRVKRFVRNFEDLYWLSEKYWDTGCIRHFKMNDNAANAIVVDSSLNAGHGTAQQNTSILTTTGKVNAALSFNGSIDHIELGDNFTGIVGKANDYTIDAYIYPTAQPGTVINICPGGDTNNRNGIVVGDGFIRGGYWNGVSYVGKKGSVILNAWQHVVLINSGGQISLLINDIPQTEEGMYGLNQENRIGHNASWHFTGKIDNVRIFNRASVENETKLLYNAGNGTEKVPAKYESFNFTCSLIQENSEGELPKTTLTVSNVTQFLQEFLEEMEGLVDSTILFTIIHADNLGEDYAELQTIFEVLASRVTAMDVIFDVGGMSLLRQRFPLHRYFADLCRHRFENARCQYARKTVVGVTLSGTDPVSVQVTAHTFNTGDAIRLAGIAGITPSLDGTYVITKVDVNNFTLNGTNSSNYAGSYTSGGTASYSVCSRRLVDCRQRTNSAHFGAFPGLESGSIRIA